MTGPHHDPIDSSRRTFMQATLAAGALGMGMTAPSAGSAPQRGGTSPHLDILILGGTGFLGPHIVESALERGHAVTLFNRGKTNPDLFPDLEQIRGNRDPQKGAGLEGLERRRFDAVVDTSGYYPRIVRASAEMLAPNVGQYVFISSISVYADTSVVGIDEDDPVATMEDPTVESFGDRFQNYGPLKALCEQAAEKAMPRRTTAIRPGLIVGPRDSAPRFTYWPVRVERGGEVLAPGDHDDPVQYIDARDLADFVVTCLEHRTMGVFNATGPNTPTNIAELLYGCKAVTGGSATFTWVDAEFLAAHNVQGWTHMPVWVPPAGDSRGFHRVNIDKAIEAGLRSRPLAQTVADTLEWYHAWPSDVEFVWAGGMEPEREREVLAAWHERGHSR